MDGCERRLKRGPPALSCRGGERLWSHSSKACPCVLSLAATLQLLLTFNWLTGSGISDRDNGQSRALEERTPAMRQGLIARKRILVFWLGASVVWGYEPRSRPMLNSTEKCQAIGCIFQPALGWAPGEVSASEQDLPRAHHF